MDNPSPSPAEFVVVWKDESEKLILDRASIQTQELTARELGILVYAISIITDPKLSPPNRKVEIENLIDRFPEDNPISLVLAVKDLIKRNYLEEDPDLNLDLARLLQERYGQPMQ